MKVKEIKELDNEKLEELMTDEEWDKMKKLGFEYAWQLLDAMQEGVKLSDLEDDEEYTTISEYLEYLEEMRTDYFLEELLEGDN